MPRRAKVVDVLAVRLVKQGTETTRFRTGSPLHLCQYVYMQASMIIYSSTIHCNIVCGIHRTFHVYL